VLALIQFQIALDRLRDTTTRGLALGQQNRAEAVALCSSALTPPVSAEFKARAVLSTARIVDVDDHYGRAPTRCDALSGQSQTGPTRTSPDSQCSAR